MIPVTLLHNERALKKLTRNQVTVHENLKHIYLNKHYAAGRDKLQ